MGAGSGIEHMFPLSADGNLVRPPSSSLRNTIPSTPWRSAQQCAGVRHRGRGVWWCSRGFAGPHVSRMPSERGERSPMSRAPSLRRRLLSALAGAMLLLGPTGAAARGEAMGNRGTSLGNFGRDRRDVFLGRILAGEGVHKVVGAERPAPRTGRITRTRVGQLSLGNGSSLLPA